MKRLIKICIVLVVCIYGLIYLNNRPDFTGEYESFAEALKDENSNGSWIPNFLPATAKNIYVQYSLSPSNYKLEFSYNLSTQEEMLTLFEPVNTEIADVILRKLKKYKWQIEIKDQVSVYKQITSLNADFKPKVLYMVLDEINGVAWCGEFWEESGEIKNKESSQLDFLFR